MADFVE